MGENFFKSTRVDESPKEGESSQSQQSGQTVHCENSFKSIKLTDHPKREKSFHAQYMDGHKLKVDGSPKEGENSFKYMDGDKLKSTKWTDHPNRIKKIPASKKVNSRRI